VVLDIEMIQEGDLPPSNPKGRDSISYANTKENTVVLDIYIRIDTLLVTFSLTPFSSHKVLRHTESSLRTDTLLVKVLA
jgi:hypothetical protein